MRYQDAKRIKLHDLMAKLGYEVKAVERGGAEHKYNSPLRQERDASFNVNLPKNQWYDFGETGGGNTLDFAVKYLESRGEPHAVSDALRWLDTVMGHQPRLIPERKIPVTPNQQSFSFSQLKSVQAGERAKLEFIKAAPIENTLIIRYLRERGISEDLARNYLREIHYRNIEKGKNYFGFGMENLSGGYEVRSASDRVKFKTRLNAI